ncbi:jg26297, partial [Pararge aegeria aegeria]
SERSKVRVSFYQGVRPQCLSPPPAQSESHVHYADLLSAAANVDMAEHTMYNRQISTESGWDNPFRPDGDLSREADEIVSLIKGGKPITPTPPVTNQVPICDEQEEKVHANNLNASPPASPQTKVASPVQQKTANGTKNGTAVPEVRAGPVDVLRSPPQEPLQPEHVTIKKKQMCKCCVIQ